LKFDLLKIDLAENIEGCANFQWFEALWLNKAKMHVFPANESIYLNLVSTAKLMQRIRSIFGEPLIVTSWYRPKEYNKTIGGAENSYHVRGLACDFQVRNMHINDAKDALKPHLERLNIRMEDIKGNWIHIDQGDPGSSKRFFKP
jgi:hypothetical protein